MDKLLIICGTTATGKTSLALKLAKTFNAEIISADSRQIYQDMDIGTGKDLPEGSKWQIANSQWQGKKLGYYLVDNVKLWGYDLINPDEEFSVAHFKKIAWLIISDIWQRKKLPIVVGGTGLYIKALTEPMDAAYIPPNRKLRKQLERQTVHDLQIKLKKINPQHFKKMNPSDRKNPRRLIRAIEISDYKKSHRLAKDFKDTLIKDDLVLWIGLKAPKSVLYEKIDKRVDQRLRLGAENEVKALLKKGYSFELPAMSALGYKQWESYFEGKESKTQVIKRWKLDEHAYARRQLTWFKKNRKIFWFYITALDYKKKVVRRVKQWYSRV